MCDMQTLPTHTALEAFLRGFSTTRSFAKPFQVNHVAENVWMLADPPYGKGAPRNSEFVAYGAEPETVVDTIHRQTAARYSLSVLLDRPDDLPTTVAEYKSRGFRYHGREPLFVLDLDHRVSFQTVGPRRVTTHEDATAVAKAARSRQIPPAHIGDSDRVCRLYATFENEIPIGWVRSIRTHSDCAWVSNMFVSPDHRRKGIGRSLLSAMLDDDARHGVQWSVLLSSLTGAKLYPHLGYREQGVLLIFSPAPPRNGAG